MQDGITQAFDRIEDFLAVQGARPPMEAVLNLQVAVGIEDRARAVVRERVASLGYSQDAGAILLGMLVGLLAAQESRSHPVAT